MPPVSAQSLGTRYHCHTVALALQPGSIFPPLSWALSVSLPWPCPWPQCGDWEPLRTRWSDFSQRCCVFHQCPSAGEPAGVGDSQAGRCSRVPLGRGAGGSLEDAFGDVCVLCCHMARRGSAPAPQTRLKSTSPRKARAVFGAGGAGISSWSSE